MHFFAIIIILLLTGCSATYELPNSGYVYKAEELDFEYKLTPVRGALVLVSRGYSCQKGFLMEGSTNGIDRYLVKTNLEGLFQVPDKTFEAPCKGGAYLIAEPYVKGYKKIGLYFNQGFKKPNRKLNREDVVVIKGGSAHYRYAEIHSSFGSFGNYTSEEIDILCREIAPEILSIVPENDMFERERNELFQGLEYCKNN